MIGGRLEDWGLLSRSGPFGERLLWKDRLRRHQYVNNEVFARVRRITESMLVCVLVERWSQMRSVECFRDFASGV